MKTLKMSPMNFTDCLFEVTGGRRRATGWLCGTL